MIKELLLVAALALTPLTAEAITFGNEMTVCHSGSWYQPSTSGQGISLEVMTKAAHRPDVVAYFYTHNTGGWPVWLTCEGDQHWTQDPLDGFYYKYASLVCHTAVLPPPHTYKDMKLEHTGNITLTAFDQYSAIDLEYNASAFAEQALGLEDQVLTLTQIISVCD